MFSYLFFYPFYCSSWWSDVFKNCYVEKRKRSLFLLDKLLANICAFKCLHISCMHVNNKYYLTNVNMMHKFPLAVSTKKQKLQRGWERDGRNEGFRRRQIQTLTRCVSVLQTNPTCRQSRHVSFFQQPSSFCFNKLEKSAQWTAEVERVRLLPWSRGGTRSDVIFPTTHCSLDSPPPTILPSLFFSFSLVQSH